MKQCEKTYEQNKTMRANLYCGSFQLARYSCKHFVCCRGFCGELPRTAHQWQDAPQHLAAHLPWLQTAQSLLFPLESALLREEANESRRLLHSPLLYQYAASGWHSGATLVHDCQWDKSGIIVFCWEPYFA